MKYLGYRSDVHYLIKFLNDFIDKNILEDEATEIYKLFVNTGMIKNLYQRIIVLCVYSNTQDAIIIENENCSYPPYRRMDAYYSEIDMRETDFRDFYNENKFEKIIVFSEGKATIIHEEGTLCEEINKIVYIHSTHAVSVNVTADNFIFK